MLDFYTFSSQRASAGDLGVTRLLIACTDDGEPHYQGRAVKLPQNDTLLLRVHVVKIENSLHSSFTFSQLEIQFCIRCFAASAPGWHAFILEGKRLKSQELPAAGWR